MEYVEIDWNPEWNPGWIRPITEEFFDFNQTFSNVIYGYRICLKKGLDSLLFYWTDYILHDESFKITRKQLNTIVFFMLYSREIHDKYDIGTCKMRARTRKWKSIYKVSEHEDGSLITLFVLDLKRVDQ